MKKTKSSSDSIPAGVQTSLEALLSLKAEARGFSFLPRQPVTSLLAGRHSSRLRGRGLDFLEMRHYQQGDDIRTIDWRATARLRSPHVRVYTEERERPVLLVVDQRRTMFFGSGRAMKSVVAAELSALAAWRTLSSGDRVGGIIFNDHEIIDLPPHRSQTRVLRLLHEVVRHNRMLVEQIDASPSPATESILNMSLEAALRRAKHDHLVVLVSDLDGGDENTQRLATQIAAHNDMLVLAVYDPLGASLQGHPGMIARDRGVNFAIPSGRSFADSFEKAFAAVLDRWTEIFRALRVPVLPISAATSPTHQLRDLFGAHLARRTTIS
ncbi:Protein of unknown function DUF58 [Desulfopila aestuarii DSM 18488]|uniref:DUF58 domain-containing protein n=1 Tax=Desulfopila aestuarii DSM 18488 TaxID=1121416 RepID=A0A1M7YFC8_9BACT|nr:DUF58 domain-containing protein [Desulfopila aestuarii]SHO51218.1 Protein of unknown function DUF58 [Desulfopila aestuarii DSM 18488]